MDKSLAVIVDSRTDMVVWFKVAPDEKVEDYLDEAAERFKFPTGMEKETLSYRYGAVAGTAPSLLGGRPWIATSECQ